MLIDTPTIAELSRVMVNATAPAFILGALASFISVILGRQNGIIDRARMIGAIADNDTYRAPLKSDLPRLRRRSYMLQRSIRFAIASAIVTILLICLGFLMAFFGQRHELGGAIMFLVALALFGTSLVYLAREVAIGLNDSDHIG